MKWKIQKFIKKQTSPCRFGGEKKPQHVKWKQCINVRVHLYSTTYECLSESSLKEKFIIFVQFFVCLNGIRIQLNKLNVTYRSGSEFK